jgi:sodium pump decarboxylase gamma subunit
MIFAGLKLAVVGMGIVILFLLLLILIVNISFKLLAGSSAKELAEIEAAELRKQRRTVPAEEKNVIVAIISAVIAAHRSRAVSPR